MCAEDRFHKLLVCDVDLSHSNSEMCPHLGSKPCMSFKSRDIFKLFVSQSHFAFTFIVKIMEYLILLSTAHAYRNIIYFDVLACNQTFF